MSQLAGSPDSGTLHLWVSNQSFEIDPVLIEIYVDGERVVCQEFQVEGQHNWILFEVELDPGRHTLRAVGNEGAAEMEESFEFIDEHWAVVDFWFYPEDPPQRLAFGIYDTPILFQ